MQEIRIAIHLLPRWGYGLGKSEVFTYGLVYTLRWGYIDRCRTEFLGYGIRSMPTTLMGINPEVLHHVFIQLKSQSWTVRHLDKSVSINLHCRG